jgi:hypothetical protein
MTTVGDLPDGSPIIAVRKPFAPESRLRQKNYFACVPNVFAVFKGCRRKYFSFSET